MRKVAGGNGIAWQLKASSRMIGEEKEGDEDTGAKYVGAIGFRIRTRLFDLDRGTCMKIMIVNQRARA